MKDDNVGEHVHGKGAESDQPTTTTPVSTDEWKLIYKATIHMVPSVYDTWKNNKNYPDSTRPRLSVASACADCWFKDPLVDNWRNAKISEVKSYSV